MKFHFQTYYTFLLLSKQYTNYAVFFPLHPPCGSLRKEGINCECELLCRQNMVWLHLTPPCLLQPRVC